RDAAWVARRADAPQLETAGPARTRSLWQLVDAGLDWQEFDQAPSHEQMGETCGFTLYRTRVDLSRGGVLDLAEVRDRAQVFCDRAPVGVLDRSEGTRALTLPTAGSDVVLEFLIEDQGRVNYGPRIGEK